MKNLIQLLFSGTLLLVSVSAGAAEPLIIEDPVIETGAEESLPLRSVAAEDESIYVVQELAFSKSGQIEFDIFLTTKVNPKFVGYMGLGLSAAMHLRENFAIEVNTTIPGVLMPFYSDLVYEVFTYEDLAPQMVDLKVMDYTGSVSFQFSALYGKLKFYPVILDYDLYVLAGVGVARTQQACMPQKDGCSEGHEELIGRGLKIQEDFTDAWKITGNIGGGLRFFFSDFMGLRFEVRDVVYSDRDIQSSETTTDIRNNLMFSSGVSFLF